MLSYTGWRRLSDIIDAPKYKQFRVIRYLRVEYVSQNEINRHMAAVYNVLCISLATVKRWSKRFKYRYERCYGDPRLGQSHHVFTFNIITQVDELIRQEQKISIDELAEGVKKNQLHFAHTIIHAHISYRFLCAMEPISCRTMTWRRKLETFWSSNPWNFMRKESQVSLVNRTNV